ncbi:DUF4255 domain-containing protein [Microbacterium sp. NPDC019599]|uniref:DUF4255 domain-containing protein n=1 Tax=Microbacterium sp. NPDC019599 TaxID=3154690 RepID=UPI0033FB942F
MSNALSVAATTAALAYRLTQAMAGHGFGGAASPGRPEPPVDTTTPSIKVFLYRVEPNAARRNDDLPTRSGSAIVTRPAAALTLQYLLVFLGDEATAVPDRLLGVAATTLHAQPLLTPEEIDAGWTPLAGGATQDLAGAPDRVRLSILGLGLEDLSHVWSTLMGQPYRLSLGVTADVVRLEPDVTPIRPVPVTTRSLASFVVLSPEITSVAVAGSAPGAPAPIVAGARLELRGRDLMSEDASVVLFGDTEVVPDGASSTPPAESPAADRLFATLPASTPPGVLGVAVEHRRALGSPPSARTVRRSPLHAIVVAPVVSSATLAAPPTPSGTTPQTYSGRVDIVMQQAVPDDQAVTMHLTGGGRAFVFEQPSRTTPGPATSTNNLAIDFGGVPAGDYLVRVVIAGAASAPVVATAGPQPGTIIGPKVALP